MYHIRGNTECKILFCEMNTISVYLGIAINA